MYKTIKISEKTHKKLLEYISKRQIETGKRVTMDEAIKRLLEVKKNENDSERRGHYQNLFD